MIHAIQAALSREKLDGWLFFDHHRRDPLAYRILRLPPSVEPTRRWYYFVPASGEPQKLVHRIEAEVLDSLPGEQLVYASWIDQRDKLAAILPDKARVALQYSPSCAIPYVSLIDAGTFELVKSCGVEPQSSANLVQEFEATWSAAQLATHREAQRLIDRIRRESFTLVAERLRCNVAVNEFEVQQFIRDRFREHGLETNHGPIVAVNANASNPHYEPSRERNAAIHPGDLVLIDLWAKLRQPDAVYYDITWTGYCGEVVPERIQNIFAIVRDARKLACQLVIDAVQRNEVLAGWQVDDKARGHISAAGLGSYFFHRTGHNIGTEVHGTGANMDNLESHDERRIIPNTCFSVEPGIYLPEFGIRSEVNVFVEHGKAFVTGEEQNELVNI